jgi:hypothetical protein
MAPQRVPSVLAVEVPASGTALSAERHPSVGPASGPREPHLGRGTHRQRVETEAGHPGFAPHGRQVSRPGPRRKPDPSQRWLTFVRNHAQAMVAWTSSSWLRPVSVSFMSSFSWNWGGDESCTSTSPITPARNGPSSNCAKHYLVIIGSASSFTTGTASSPGITASLDHPEIPRNRPFREQQTKFQKLAVDLGSAPGGILPCHPQDQFPKFERDLGPAASGSTRPPTPVQPESGAMPPDHSLRLDN